MILLLFYLLFFFIVKFSPVMAARCVCVWSLCLCLCVSVWGSERLKPPSPEILELISRLWWNAVHAKPDNIPPSLSFLESALHVRLQNSTEGFPPPSSIDFGKSLESLVWPFLFGPKLRSAPPHSITFLHHPFHLPSLFSF